MSSDRRSLAGFGLLEQSPMLEEYFGKKNAHAPENLRTLEQFFNCWRNLPEGKSAKFLDRFFSYDHAVGKVRLDGRYSIDIFADCLQKYADRINERNRQFPLHRTVMLYLDACEKEQHYEWRYYYVKYTSFRPGRFGKYSWQNFETKPYEMLMMWTEFAWSSNSRQPFLYEIDKKNLDRDDCGQRLKYKDSYILCEQTAFVEKRLSDDMEIRRIEIKQDAAGIDREDRILVGRAWLGRGFADDGE